MKLISRKIDKFGSVTLMPEEPEDMWHAYNLICVGDSVRASAVRKVTVERGTGASTSNRVRITLTLTVENVEFSAEDCQLHIKGRNLVQNEYVKKLAYHTFDLELNRNFSLRKVEWDSVSLERLEKICDPMRTTDLAAVVMQEGLANVCMITNSMTLVRSKIEMQIPRKRKGHAEQHKKALNQFFENVAKALLNHVDLTTVKCVIVASPGFVKEQFMEYMSKYAKKNDLKPFLNNQDKFTLVHSSTGYRDSLSEVLENAATMEKVSHLMAASEMKLINLFFEMLKDKASKAFFGYDHCRQACEANAIETLLVSDRLFRNPDPCVRRQYIELIEKAREAGSFVKFFSSMHLSGEMLDKITGIAAILRFPMSEMEDEPEEAPEEAPEDSSTCAFSTTESIDAQD